MKHIRNAAVRLAIIGTVAAWFALVVCSVPALGDPPGLAVSRTVPMTAAATGSVKCDPGRFVPVELGSGKPALVEASDPDAVRVFEVKPGGTLIGVRYDEPAGAEPKDYSFPDAKGKVYVALARKPGLVTVRAMVNGPAATDKTPEGPPVLAGSITIQVVGILPPPDPKPPTPPDPKPPGPVVSFRVIWVAESAATLTAAQNAVVAAKAVQDYLNAKATPENRLPGWRLYDPQTNAVNDQSAMRALWDAAKGKVTTVPCVIVEVNGKSEILPFPANATEALKTLKTYGGN